MSIFIVKKDPSPKKWVEFCQQSFGDIRISVQGVPKKIRLGFCLISWQPSIGFSNHFFLLKTEIHTQILNTKPFLCDIKRPKYLQNKMGFLIRWFWSKLKLLNLEIPKMFGNEVPRFPTFFMSDSWLDDSDQNSNHLI